MARVEPALAGAQVVLPAVPWTAQHFSSTAVLELADARRPQKTVGVARAERSALVRTAIQDREVFAFDVEHADGSATDLDDLPLARRNLVDGGYHPLCHVPRT